MRCSPCGRQFESIEDLLQHYVTSAIHPTCLKCEEGYVDDETYHKVSFATLVELVEVVSE